MSQAEHAGQTFTPQERRITLVGVLLVFLLSALDQTIVSTAMPRIIAQLQGLSLYAWVTTAYMLSSTVMVPIYGKLGDIYGRKPVLVAGIAIFMGGSFLCGLAGEFGRLPLLGGGMTQLIVFRGLQGLGGGALFTSAFAIIADMYPPRERAKFAGMFGGVFGLASILGPVIGGFFTDLDMTHVAGVAVAGWRWIFYVNIPVALLSLFMIISRMPRFTHRNPGKIDFAGAALIVVTFVPLLLALSWGGRNYPWSSPVIAGLFAVSACGLVAFVLTERVVTNPIVSMGLFKNKVFSTANAGAFVSSMAFMGSLTFLPLYLQLGLGVKATTSGLSILPMMIGMIASSSTVGQFISRTGKYKPFMMGGSALTVVGLVFLSRVGTGTTLPDLSWRLLLLGVGLGPSMSTFNIVIQNAVGRAQMGVATSASQFFRQIGGTVGIALFGAILTHNFAAAAPSQPAAPGVHAQALDLQTLMTGTIGDAPPNAAAPQIHVDQAVRAMVVHAVTGVFKVGVGVAGLAFCLVAMIPVLPLEHRGRGAPAPEPKSEAEVEADAVAAEDDPVSVVLH